MRSVRSLDLSDAEYVVTPSRSLREGEAISALRTLVSGDGEEYHLYDVRDSEGGPVLEVVVTVEHDVSGDGFVQTGSVDKTYEFRTPGGDPRLVVRPTGLTTGYEVEDATTGETLATFGPGLPAIWRWKLRDESGNATAVVRKPAMGVLRNAVPFAGKETYVVRSSGGAELARFRRKRVGGGGPSEMAVSLTDPAFPGEVLVALAFGLLRESGSTDVGGD